MRTILSKFDVLIGDIRRALVIYGGALRGRTRLQYADGLLLLEVADQMDRVLLKKYLGEGGFELTDETKKKAKEMLCRLVAALPSEVIDTGIEVTEGVVGLSKQMTDKDEQNLEN